MKGREGSALALALAVGALAGLPAAPQETGPDAVAALEATLEVERKLLDEDLGRQQSLARERAAGLERLGDLYRALDAAVGRKEAAEALEDILGQIEAAERARAEQLQRERLLVERIRERMRTIALLEEELARLQEQAVARRGPLDGPWDVVLAPLNQRGVFHLRQSGAVVNGTYRLEGGWTGSLQGTLVERKVRLVRIDSQLGRSMELEGFLSADGSQIRGTWLNYDLSGDVPPSGQWVATRHQPTSP